MLTWLVTLGHQAAHCITHTWLDPYLLQLQERIKQHAWGDLPNWGTITEKFRND